MLIARVHPVITVYTVKGGQRKSSNHVINFHQNVTRFASILPLHPDDVPLLVRRIGADSVNHYDFRVCRDKVRAALRWLVANNKWYRGVVVDNARLDQLPEDGNFQNLFERGPAQDIDMNDEVLAQGNNAQLQEEMGMCSLLSAR
jgi:hypothetical protein